MIAPPPHKLRCEKCNYSKVVKPKSDVLTPMDFMTICPKCSGDMVYEEMQQNPNLLERLFRLYGFR